MLAPERRTRADIIAAVAIVVVVAVVAALIWQRSDARGATSEVSSYGIDRPDISSTAPHELREAWRSTDTASPQPVTAAGSVVTGEGGTVTGHDPVSGEELWRYSRNLQLCGVVGAFKGANAVYRDQRGCSQVTQLSGRDGRRLAARTSIADDQVALSTNASPGSDQYYGFVLAQGRSRLELWRYDLVRTLEYGHLDAPVNPGAQPRQGCELMSAALNNTQLSVLEHCPNENGDRLTVLKPDPKDSQKPEELGSSVVPELSPRLPGARVLSVTGSNTAVYLPPTNDQLPRIGVYDSKVNSVTTQELAEPLADRALVTKDGLTTYVWTGAELLSLDGSDLTTSWSVADAIGTPVAMAGYLLIPVSDGIAVSSVSTGQEIWRIPVERNGFGGPVTLAVIGSTILEKRGDQLVALRG